MDATGTIRRLQALHVVGWRQIDIAERIGWHQQAVAQLLTDRTFVIARTAAAVARVYDELVETPGPSRVTVSRAKNQGWLGPGWWDVDTIDDPNYRPATTDRLRQGDVDRVAVELAVDGHPLPRRLTHAELLAATSVLHDRGASAREIAGRVRASERHVVRLLADLRQVA
jgi:hypothetical protein